jgi:YidC/Oxa1 family membrane protein insertase
MDKKLLIFLLLFFAFFFVWQKFIVSPYVEKHAPPKPPPVATKNAPATTSQPNASSTPAPTKPGSPTTLTPTSSTQTHKVTVDTPLYRAEFSSKGAVLTSFRLKKYKDDFGQPLELVPDELASKSLPLTMDSEDPELTRRALNSNFSVNDEYLRLDGNSNKDIQFLFSDGRYTFRKYFKFKADSYIIDSIMEAHDGANFIPVRLSWGPGIESPKGYKKAEFLKPSRAIANVGEKVIRKDPPKEKEFVKIGALSQWAGVENNYFMGLFIPVKPADAYLTNLEPKSKSVHNVVVVMAGPKSEPFAVRIFIGPKDYELLKKSGMGLENVLDFGWFGPVAKILFDGLRVFYKYTGNWGWAILLLTVVVKIIFTPFVQKSFSSQRKLQAMQPEMKKVQEKYAKMKNDDPRKQNMNTEIMALHKRYGVNPLGGCLPMLIQMPVLFAFYRVLSNAIELRHAPFALWIHDLSRPDPYLITPILMGASMLLQQKMTPISDPTQQKMLYIMPIMFTFISKNLQSGLVLYWLFSNILGIAHQWYFQRQQKKSSVPGVVQNA